MVRPLKAGEFDPNKSFQRVFYLFYSWKKYHRNQFFFVEISGQSCCSYLLFFKNIHIYKSLVMGHLIFWNSFQPLLYCYGLQTSKTKETPLTYHTYLHSIPTYFQHWNMDEIICGIFFNYVFKWLKYVCK